MGRSDLKGDPRFADRQSRKSNRADLKRDLERVLASRSAQEWEGLLIKAGVPAGRVFTVPEILEHRHLAQRRFIKRFQTQNGEQFVTRCGFRFSDSEPDVVSPAPSLAEHTDDWLRALGYGADQIKRLRERGTI